jgi:hypothetical protein
VVSQAIGDDWLARQTSLGLVVPSAVLPTNMPQLPGVTEHNVLLNPNIPGFLSALRIVDIVSFGFDSRIDMLLQ